MERPEWLIPDQLNKLNVTNHGEEYMVGHKFDVIRHYPFIGHYVLKLYDDTQGLLSLHLTEEIAHRIADKTTVEIVEHKKISQKEYEDCLEAKAQMLDDEMFGGFDDTI